MPTKRVITHLTPNNIRTLYMGRSRVSTKKSQSKRSRRSRRSRRSKKSQPQRISPIPEPQPILLLKSEADAENNKVSPPGRNITKDHVPRMTYPHTEKDEFDGIVFLVGHSEIKGEQHHVYTRPRFRQRTLLVANVGNTCVWFSEPKTVEAFIRERFSDALSYAPTNIEEFIHTVKGHTRKLPKIIEKMEERPDYKSFYDTRGKFSNILYDIKYCEREWQFFTQEGERKPDGRVMLLRRDKNGKSYFKVLYKDKIDEGNFQLTKTELYDDLYDNYRLRNVLLVDFGCTNISGVDSLGLLKIRSGQFGGSGPRRT